MLKRAAAVAAAIAVLGLAAFYGLNPAGAASPGTLPVARAEAAIQDTASPDPAPQDGAPEDVQKVRTSLSPFSYEPITVTAGIPVEWTIDAPEGSINGCNYMMVVPELNIGYEFTTGETVIRFTPDKAGTYPYSCWMGMIASTITVLEPGAAADNQTPQYTVPPIAGSCCG